MLLEFTINHMDILDALHGPTEIQTTFLDVYDRKDPTTPIGATIHLVGLQVDRVLCAGQTYRREELPDHVAHGLVCGLVLYVQACSHIYDAHYRLGFRLAQRSHALLPVAHPIRQVLLPTEVGVVNAFSRQASTLINQPGGWFMEAFPLTWKGLHQMVADHRPIDCAALTGDYGRWWEYIHSYMTRVTQAVYPNEAALHADHPILAWMDAPAPTVAGLATLLSEAFFVQVRHTRLSNPAVEHIFRYMHILDPAPVRIATAAQTVAVGRATSEIGGVPLSRDFSGVVDHRAARNILHEFYTGLGGPFARTIVDPGLLPSAVCTSLNK